MCVIGLSTLDQNRQKELLPERANRASQNSKLGINWANIDQDRPRMGDPIRNEMVTHFSACRPLLAEEGIVSLGLSTQL